MSMETKSAMKQSPLGAFCDNASGPRSLRACYSRIRITSKSMGRCTLVHFKLPVHTTCWRNIASDGMADLTRGLRTTTPSATGAADAARLLSAKAGHRADGGLPAQWAQNRLPIWVALGQEEERRVATTQTIAKTTVSVGCRPARAGLPNRQAHIRLPLLGGAAGASRHACEAACAHALRVRVEHICNSHLMARLAHSQVKSKTGG